MTHSSEVDILIPQTETLRRAPALEAAAIARRAKEQVAQLTGLTAERVSGVARDSDGWHVSVDVVELKRIPEASDILATYDVMLDERGRLLNCQRARRYCRGQVAG